MQVTISFDDWRLDEFEVAEAEKMLAEMIKKALFDLRDSSISNLCITATPDHKADGKTDRGVLRLVN